MTPPRRDLQPGEGPRVETKVLEALTHRLDRVDRGEADPFVTTGDQALDRAVHLMRRARGLDADGRHHIGAGAVGGEQGATADPAWSWVRGMSTRHP